MSKIFIIGNTNFNISKNLSTKEWLKIMNHYYYNDFLPYLKNNTKQNDILIHLGNFLYNTKSVDLNVLNFIQKLFENISDILSIYIIEGENDNLSLNVLKNFKNVEIINEQKCIELQTKQKITFLPYNTKFEDIDNLDSEYCFFNIDYLNSSKKDLFINKLNNFKKCYNGYYDKNSVTGNIKNLGSPYNTEVDLKKGFIILDTNENKDKFIQNKISPNFKKIHINNEEDLNNLSKKTFENNYISLNINKKLLINNKLKIEMMISEYDIKNITYLDEEIIKDKEDILELNESSLSLNEMVVDYINNSEIENKEIVLKEFKNLIELNKK